MLIAAELIGNVYYRALEMATKCQRLRVLCRMLVADELAHIGFDSDVLLALRARRSPFARWTIGAAHRAFMFARRDGRLVHARRRAPPRGLRTEELPARL